jgi:hypothetical protein
VPPYLIFSQLALDFSHNIGMKKIRVPNFDVPSYAIVVLFLKTIISQMVIAMINSS